MTARYYLGIDNGTTGTTALLLDENWQPVGRGYQELASTAYPNDGWVEQDAMEIWYSVPAAVSAACDAAGIQPEQIRSIGIDNVGETVVLWDRNTGIPVHPAIVWQDRRTAGYCDSISEEYGKLVRERTGLMIDSYFSATKMKWIMDHVEEAQRLAGEGRLLAGTLDGWLIWKMTRGRVFVTDPSTASRTMLMNIRTGEWDQDMLDLFGIRRQMLPEIVSSAGLIGKTDPESFLGVSVPIGGAAVDQQAALFGQTCFDPGMIKCTYGTGCFMLMNTGNTPVFSENGIVTTVAWGLDGKLTYALDGGIYVAGAATQWLRDKLGIIRSAAETEEMAIRAGGNGGVYFVPAFSGLAAPHWDSYARGTMIGLTGAATRDHIVRATLEATAYQVSDNLDMMVSDAGISVDRLRVDGGAVVNRFLMQFQADILGIPIDVPQITETTALGAAYLSALGIGDFGGPDDIRDRWKIAQVYEPAMGKDERQELLHQWHRAVERSRAWVEE